MLVFGGKAVSPPRSNSSNNKGEGPKIEISGVEVVSRCAGVRGVGTGYISSTYQMPTIELNSHSFANCDAIAKAAAKVNKKKNGESNTSKTPLKPLNFFIV